MEICRLSDALAQQDAQWTAETAPPVSECEIAAFEQANDVVLPEEYKVCLCCSNGFKVGFSSRTGDVHFYSLQQIQRAKERTIQFATSQAEIDRKLSHLSIGWHNHRMLYFDVSHGTLLIEKVRYQYEAVTDLYGELLQGTVEHLARSLQLILAGKALLAQRADNPYRKYYDRLSALKAGYGADISFCPPVSDAEIRRWEQEQGVVLPDRYKQWLRLSNGSTFGNTELYSLDRIARYRADEIRDSSGQVYLCFAAISGCFDYLMFHPETGAVRMLTEDFEWRDDISMEELLFERPMEYIEEDFA